MKLTVEQTYGGLSAEELAMLRAARDSIEGVENMTPSQVFQIVGNALRGIQKTPLLDAPKS